MHWTRPHEWGLECEQTSQIKMCVSSPERPFPKWLDWCCCRKNENNQEENNRIWSLKNSWFWNKINGYNIIAPLLHHLHHLQMQHNPLKHCVLMGFSFAPLAPLDTSFFDHNFAVSNRSWTCTDWCRGADESRAESRWTSDHQVSSLEPKDRARPDH